MKEGWLRERSPFIIASAIFGFLMLVFILLPIINTVALSVDKLGSALMSFEARDAIFMSFYAAFLATLFTFIFGVPLAYTLARYDFPGKSIIDASIDLPILIPHDAAGIALLLLFGPRTMIGTGFSSIGINFVDTLFGIVLAMAFVSSPFMIRSAEDAFKAINPDVEKVARSLGASNFKAFLHVTFPLAFRGILTGCLLTWARSISEFGAVIILASVPRTAPVYLYDVFGNQGLGAAVAITALLIITAVVIFVIIKLVTAKPLKPVY
ncbi:MAG: ABC transporter permease [Candidatus Bathyarchaeota archaeon]|nr:ABC transporter permease [Candidatus Bathyarchaeota archaeon]MDH5747148.1 ABC transporter permease [Candidatus Bathyarchaeota archaeon]